MKKYLIPLVALALLGAACKPGALTKNTNQTTGTTTNTSANTSVTNISSSIAAVSWEFDGSVWRSSGVPPACSDPIALAAPVDLAKATSILYPGQSRGNNYKPHGGFRFDGSANEAITVSVPLDAVAVQGSRYIEQGEVQHLLEFIAPCGLMYRFDHLLTLSPAFQALADQLPAAQPDDSRTTKFSAPLSVRAGEIIATAVGFKQTQNVSVDFGTYDLRRQNSSAANTTWAAARASEKSLAYYGTCWFDYLSMADETRVRSLPAGDSAAGTSSDYCL